MLQNRIDTIKALYVYTAAVFVVIGGMACIAFLPFSADDPRMTIIGGFVGFAAQFLFGQETATRTTRQVIAAQASNGDQLSKMAGT